MQQQADEDELGLSSAALAALKEFALENDMLGELGGPFRIPLIIEIINPFSWTTCLSTAG